MNVPFRLRRRDIALPTTGLLLVGRDTAAVVEAIAQIGLPLAEIYAVPDGFLIRRREPFAVHPPGTLRLRELAPHLFLPVDADLIPGLLDDEAVALVREQGLIFLPGDQVFAYDRDAQIRLSELMVTAPVRRGAWNEPPPGSRLVERIRVILDERPPPAIEAIFNATASDVGSEGPARPPQASTTLAAITGTLQAGVGRFLVWLGGALNWRWLARKGANLIGRAMQNNPRTAENVLGRQEAALRELLRQFREGDRNEALRRALPIGGGTQRGATTSGTADLPTHNLLSFLGDLLGGGRGGGPASVWITPEAVAAQLAEEYRRSARDAATAGDYSRAAFIYGKLLGDYRLAADMLARAGMHHEAALLYLDRVADERAAAACFAAAGDVDRAIQLYRKNRAHIEAGDILRSVGEDDAALEEYRLAANRLIERGRPHEAGDLYREHVQRPDLALPCYVEGWQRRPAPGTTQCALRLLDLRVQTRDCAGLMTLAEEVSDYYARNGAESEAVQVFNHLVRLGDQTLPPEQREELRDRALVGLAMRLRLSAATDRRPGDTVSALLGREGVWAANVVADAEVALRGELRRHRNPTPSPSRDGGIIVPLGHRGVTAVAGSENGEALFVGFEDGHIVRFRPTKGSYQEIEQENTPGPIDSLGTDPLGLRLLALSGGNLLAYGPKGSGTLSLLQQSPTLTALGELPIFLTQLIAHAGDKFALIWGPETTILIDSLGTIQCRWDSPAGEITGAVAVPGRPPVAVRFSHGQVAGFELRAGASEPLATDFGASLPPPGDRAGPLQVHVYHEEGEPPLMSLVAHNEARQLWLLYLIWKMDRLVVRGCWYAQEDGYLAECQLDRDQVVGVRRNEVVWLRRERQHLEVWARSPAALEDAVAVWPGWQGREVIVVRARGDLVRIPRPR